MRDPSCNVKRRVLDIKNQMHSRARSAPATKAATMRSHEITVDGRARIVASIEEWRQTLASGTSRDGYVKHLTMSRWMFYVLKNGEQDFESTDMDDAIKRYNDL